MADVRARSWSGWRSTPATPRSATTTTSGRRSTATARLLAIGHGGQILVSAAGAALVADDLPDGASLLDRGEHHLKDLARPEHVYQLGAPGLADGLPAAALGRRADATCRPT